MAELAALVVVAARELLPDRRAVVELRGQSMVCFNCTAACVGIKSCILERV